MATSTDAAAPAIGDGAPRPGRGPTSREGALAGAVAAGVALGTGELVAGAAGSDSTLVTAVGSEFIDRFAASLKDAAIAIFGTNDKAALIIGIVVVSLLLGASFGRAAVRRPLVAVGGFVVFGAVGLGSYLADPLGRPVAGVIASAVAVAAGLGVLFGLLHLLRLPSPTSPDVDGTASLEGRRAFLVGVGGSVVGAALFALMGRRLGRSDIVDAARQDVALPPTGSAPVAGTVPASGPPLEVPGISPFITPNEDFYRIDTALRVPQVDVDGWTLKIDGLVDRPFELTYDELVGMSTSEDTVTLQCVSNEVGGNLIGTATWQGVPLASLLERAGVQDGASQIVGWSVDDFSAGFPTAVALDGRTALVAVAMNGEPLPATHGFPARLVVAGLYGYVSATKWLRRIEVTTWEGFDGYWVPRGWSKEGPIKTASRIDVPRSGTRLAPGRQAVAGVAWSPPTGIAKVEVQIDDGDWQEAELGGPATGNTWVQWKLAWEATEGEHRLRVRATDTAGVTQTEESARPAPDGATGWHQRTVRVR